QIPPNRHIAQQPTNIRNRRILVLTTLRRHTTLPSPRFPDTLCIAQSHVALQSCNIPIVNFIFLMFNVHLPKMSRTNDNMVENTIKLTPHHLRYDVTQTSE
ncbi:hypothetical protein QO231_15455, partial [Sedimentitalea todarodis]|nr:hypothetical protein [Sedimentitalea todarodis]